ncbi:MAG: glycosyltransferase family 2 protein, partial [Bacteroidaceae bacterium]|nr:glycosyltransferase family 2 protein [Bacteroidaceae bacterium]
DFQTWMKRDGYTHCYACNKLFKRSLWGDTMFPIGRYYEDIFTIPYVLQRATKIRGTKHGMYYYCKRDGSISNTPKLNALSDYVEALVQLQELPENQQNFALYLRSLNAQLSYHQHGGKEKIVPHRPLPLSFILSSHLTLHQRIKALWFRLTYHPRT